jgi:hypothetical protein
MGARAGALSSIVARGRIIGPSAESFRNCDPSGSLSNLRLAVPVEVVALRAA